VLRRVVDVLEARNAVASEALVEGDAMDARLAALFAPRIGLRGRKRRTSTSARRSPPATRRELSDLRSLELVLRRVVDVLEARNAVASEALVEGEARDAGLAALVRSAHRAART
jgi:hypothetical protein